MISIVIPVHNEEVLLESLVSGIHSGLSGLKENFELILCENGSSDNTLKLAHTLAASYPNLVVLDSPQASYGAAIRMGIMHSRGERIIVFNADLWDIEFLHNANRLLGQYDIVIASKRHQDSQDQRPFNRRFITWAFNVVLQILFGFKGTDTHGMKAFNRARITPIVRRCITDREIFDSEVILRAQQAGLTTTEVAAFVEETRPSRYSPFIRIPRTLRDLWTLYKDMHFAPVSKSSEV